MPKFVLSEGGRYTFWVVLMIMALDFESENYCVQGKSVINHYVSSRAVMATVNTKKDEAMPLLLSFRGGNISGVKRRPNSARNILVQNDSVAITNNIRGEQAVGNAVQRKKSGEVQCDSVRVTRRLPSLSTGRLLIIVAAAIYGTNFATVKIVDKFVPLEWSATARFSLAASVCLAAKPTALNKENLQATLGGMTVGFWYFIGYILQSYGLKKISAGKNSFYSALAVLVVPLLDLAIKGSIFTINQAASILMALAGVSILQLGGESYPASKFELDFGIGDIISLGQAIAFGIGYWVLESVSSKHGDKADMITVGQLGAVAIGCWTYALIVGTLPTAVSLKTWISNPVVIRGVLWSALASTTLALYMETVALQVVSASELTIIMTSVSIWGSLWAFLFLGEVPTKALIGGGVLILIACLLPSLNVNPPKNFQN